MADEAPAAWPDPMKPGVPLNPERDGWHWVSPGGCDDAFPAEWRVAGECERGRWAEGWIVGEDEHDPIACTYLGPCVTPPDLAAREAAARIEGREDVLTYLDALVASLDNEGSAAGLIGSYVLRVPLSGLRGAALPPVPGADALAERIASAVAAEREAAWNAGRDAAFLKMHECLVGVAENVDADPRIAGLPANEAAAINMGFKAAGDALALAARACRPACAEAKPSAKEMTDGR